MPDFTADTIAAVVSLIYSGQVKLDSRELKSAVLDAMKALGMTGWVISIEAAPGNHQTLYCRCAGQWC